MPSSTVENYVKQLYLAQQEAGSDLIPTGRIAAIMGVVPGTATAMVKTLADSGLVEYAPRGGVRLSRGGEQLALHVLRRHRLLELFLVNIVGLDWSEVHDDAEELEHVVSDRLLDRIDALLGYPSVDPHGDPIPTAKGRLAPVSATSLLQCELNTPMRITRVLDQAPPFLRFVTQHGLVPDATLIVQSRSEEADAVALRPAGRKPVTLGAAAAAKILVEAA